MNILYAWNNKNTFYIIISILKYILHNNKNKFVNKKNILFTADNHFNQSRKFIFSFRRSIHWKNHMARESLGFWTDCGISVGQANARNP